MIPKSPLCALPSSSLLSRSFARRYANRRPIKPPPKIKDPLSADNAVATTIQQGSSSYTFIHRPPPSAPSPHSTAAAPASPFLRPPSSPASSTVPPLLRKEPTGHRILSETEIDEVRALRNSDPEKYTTGSLARQFGCSTKFIGLVAPLAKHVKDARLAQRDKEHDSTRETWGERKRLVKQIREKRKEFW